MVTVCGHVQLSLVQIRIRSASAVVLNMMCYISPKLQQLPKGIGITC